MKELTILITLLLFITLGVFAQQKNIKVQIMHQDQLVLDTTLNKSSKEAKLIIESLVQQFSKDPVYIDSKITHGLYVFNITNESWKGPKKKETANNIKPEQTQQAKTISEPEEISELDSREAEYNDAELDSLFMEFSSELDEAWEQMDIEIVVDSIGDSFHKLWGELKEIDFTNNPDLQEFKSDFSDFFDEIRKTQFIIIHDGDTLDLD